LKLKMNVTKEDFQKLMKEVGSIKTLCEETNNRLQAVTADILSLQ